MITLNDPYYLHDKRVIGLTNHPTALGLVVSNGASLRCIAVRRESMVVVASTTQQLSQA